MKISLFENANSFMDEAITKAILAEEDPHAWKFSILSLIQAVELLMKERLSREHSILIYSDIDKIKHTVTLEQAKSRLIKICKVNFNDHELQTITKMSSLRNEIVHHDFTINKKEIKLAFASIFKFAATFYASELDTKIQKHISKSTWEHALSIITYETSMIDAAKALVGTQHFDTTIRCPKCLHEYFIPGDDEDTCLVCGHSEETTVCIACDCTVFTRNAPTIHHIRDDEDYTYCNQCYDDILRSDYDYETNHGK